MPIHIHADEGSVAPIVLLPGDPARAERIALQLDDAAIYNRNRGLIGYTGTYHGARVSVQTTMMGAPSTAIVAEELLQLGVRTLIRVGTAGALGAGVNPGDLVVATASTPLDGTTAAYLDGRPYAPAAAYAVVRELMSAAEARSARPHVGPILTDDVFYHPDADRLAAWTAFGALAVEMEASALFTVAARHNMSAGAILTVSNFVGAATWLDPNDLQRAVDLAIGIALDAAVQLTDQR
jgi:purine-nucleoside phosphorylase